jgi:hypothetical protein
MMKIKLVALTSIVALFCLTIHSFGQMQEEIQFRTIGHLDEEALNSVVSKARIEAYDLSPDAGQLALFVASGDLVQAPSWIITVRTSDLKVVSRVQFGAGGGAVQGYAPELRFSPDGEFLVVEDGQVVRILKTRTLQTTHTVVSTDNGISTPAGLVMASASNMVAVSFGTGQSLRNYMDKRPIQTEVVDVRSGKRAASWASDDIPLSISPDAKFVAVSDHESVGPVMGIAILSASSGEKISTLSGGYAFKTAPTDGVFLTRIIAKFIGEDDLVLTPDGNKDQSGHDVGQNIKFAHWAGVQAVQDLVPERYGPVGEIVVSADRSHVVVISRYLDPEYLKSHKSIPPGTKPQLVVLLRDGKFRVAGVKDLPELLSLRRRSIFDASALRVSADGSFISVAEKYGITIFATR